VTATPNDHVTYFQPKIAVDAAGRVAAFRSKRSGRGSVTQSAERGVPEVSSLFDTRPGNQESDRRMGHKRGHH
jgi:hypothetical protein